MKKIYDVRLEQIVGIPPELKDRSTQWRKVCELERDLRNVGLTRLEASGDDYLAVPEDQEAVEEWAEEIEGLNSEGVDWSRYPLELSCGNDLARLKLLVVSYDH